MNAIVGRNAHDALRDERVGVGSARVDVAAAGRHTCVACTNRIGKGELRVVEPNARTESKPGARYADRYYHLDCAMAARPELALTALRTSAGELPPAAREKEAALAAQVERDRLARCAQYAVTRGGDVGVAGLAEGLEHRGDDVNVDALLDALADDPADLAVLGVLADALQDAGDARGELIAVQLALRAGAVELELIRRRDALMVALTPPLASRERCSWGTGYVRRVELAVRAPTLASLAALVRHPSLRVVHELQLDYEGGEDVARLACAEVAALATLRRLEWRSPFAFSELVAALPRLTALHVRNPHGDFEQLAHPGLTALELDLPSYDPAGEHNPLRRIVRAHLPAVTRLELQSTTRATDGVCSLLVASGWLEQLRELALPDAQISEGGAHELARSLGERRLARLDVTGNPLTAATRSALAALCDELIASNAPASVGPPRERAVEHANKPEWGRGVVVREFDGKIEVVFPGAGSKVFKAGAPFLREA